MLDINFVKKILNLLVSSGGSFSEIFVQKRVLNSLKLEDSRIESLTSGFELGCGLRLIYNDSTFYAYVDSLNKEKILNAAKVLKSAVTQSRLIKVLNLTEKKSLYSFNIKKYPSDINQKQKSDILFDADKKAREYSSYINQVTCRISDLEEQVFIANSLGHFIHDNNIKVFFAINVIAQKEDQIRTGYKSLAKTCGYELFEEKKASDVALEAAKMAVIMLDAVNAPAGSMPVVIGPAFGGVIFHEACGHGLEADAIIKDASVFKGKIGTKIASLCVNAVDDATLQNHWGSYAFDGEGNHSKKNILIKDGVLIQYINDYKSSKKLKVDLTGNGRRQSYRDIPIPRMSNTYIDNGKENPSSLIKSIKNGILAKEFSGGQVDPATGNFIFGISEGYLIKNGIVSEPIKGASLIGNGPEILNKIEAVGNDLDFAPGFCGKNGQSISNEVGQPTILVSSITVGGTEI